jgi:hypothetical protein
MYVFICLDPFYNHKITRIFTNLPLGKRALPKKLAFDKKLLNAQFWGITVGNIMDGAIKRFLD